MRLVAVFVVSLLCMQLPAAASIISWTDQGISRLDTWNTTRGYLTCCLGKTSLDLPSTSEASVICSATACDLALFTGCCPAMESHFADLASSTMDADEEYFNNIRIAATSVCPEPATLTIWGISALALAAATYRRQKRAGKNSRHVQAAVKEYLAACDSPSQHFRMLGSYLTRLADDPNWTKQDVEAFYDEVVVALHRRREHAEVA
jgi:hypothetical protein